MESYRTDSQISSLQRRQYLINSSRLAIELNEIRGVDESTSTQTHVVRIDINVLRRDLNTIIVDHFSPDTRYCIVPTEILLLVTRRTTLVISESSNDPNLITDIKKTVMCNIHSLNRKHT